MELREAAPFPVGWVLSALAFPAARRFSARARDYDEDCARHGFPEASQRVLRAFGVGMSAEGRARDMASGPLVVAANHPGLLDTPALAAAIGRPDLFVLAAPHRLWETMPRLRARFILLPENRLRRHAAIREAVGRLRGGAALLLYPSGRIDPDPAVDSEVVSSLDQWSQAPDFFARHVPGLKVVGASVSGVLSRESLSHPLARLHRDPRRRRWLAATLQFVSAGRQPSCICVAFTGVHLASGPEVTTAVRRDLARYWEPSGVSRR